MSDEEQQEILNCVLCKLPIEHEMFPNGGYLGNNPAPLAPTSNRCGDWCNSLTVTPARLGLTGEAAEQMGRTFARIHAVQRHTMKERMNNDAEVKQLREQQQKILRLAETNMAVEWGDTDCGAEWGAVVDIIKGWVIDNE